MSSVLPLATVWSSLAHALSFAFGMFWEILWALILGFFFSAAGLVVDLIFGAISLARTVRDAKIVEAHITLNYTTILNIIFLALAGALIWRFIRTCGLPMLRAMNTPMADEHAKHGHAPAPGRG